MAGEAPLPAGGDLIFRLRQSLQAAGDLDDSESISVSSILELLLDSPTSDFPAATVEALNAVLEFVSLPSSNQMAVEAMGLELPKVVARFAEVSIECEEIASRILDSLVSKCNPRDMLSFICEGLDIHIKASRAPATLILLLRVLSKVLSLIQRRHIEQIRAAAPVVLDVLNIVSSEADEEDQSLNNLFGASVSIGMSVQSICQNMEGTRKEELCTILGLYILQNMALISRSSQRINFESCIMLAKQFSGFIPFCNLSYIGLITGSDVSSITDNFLAESGDDFKDCFSLAVTGASLPVVWGYISDEVAKAAGEDLISVVKELQSSRIRRWQALGMLKHILSSIDYPWEIKFKSLEFIWTMMHGRTPEDYSDKNGEFSTFIPSLFAALQAIQRLIMGASSASSRKKAFDAFKEILSDIPIAERIDMLKSLIANSNSPSMTAILIDVVKEELVKESHHKAALEKDASDDDTVISLWNQNILDFVEMILKPAKGGPPTLPEEVEPVLSALNLYRFLLLTESTAKRNRTGVLSEGSLLKVYKEWLLPLRTLVSGIEAENRKECGELADSIQCALNPLQLVLFRCIELVEENLKHPL